MFATPTVELKDIRMKAIGMQGGSMDIILNVTNPNDFRLDATHLTYNLYVDTIKVAFGEIHKTATARGAQEKRSDRSRLVQHAGADPCHAAVLAGRRSGLSRERRSHGDHARRKLYASVFRRGALRQHRVAASELIATPNHEVPMPVSRRTFAKTFAGTLAALSVPRGALFAADLQADAGISHTAEAITSNG